MSSVNYSASRHAFHSKIRGKFGLTADYLEERHAFLQNNPRKVKLSANYPAESFSIPRKVKISLFTGLSLLLKLILDENSTIGDQNYPIFGRKNGITWNN